MTGERWDVAIVGAGAAGLSLAWELARGPLRRRRTLVVERDPAALGDRTFGFWAERSGLPRGVATRWWRRARVVGDGLERTDDLAPLRYWMVRGGAFAGAARRALDAAPGVSFLGADVECLEDAEHGALVVADGRAHAADWAFDSRFGAGSFEPSRGALLLWQSFEGWEVRTAGDAFDPAVVTFMDFRAAQGDGTRFFHVLPLSARRALVGHVVCAARPEAPAAHDAALARYLQDVLRVGPYGVLRRESGATPMTDHAFARRRGRRVLAVGVAGGRVKPSSGYAFRRIRQDAAAIARSLAAHGHPFDLPRPPGRLARYDAAMLELMARDGDRGAAVLTGLLARNPIGRVLRFLDEEASLLDEARLAATLPADLWLSLLPRRAQTGWAA